MGTVQAAPEPVSVSAARTRQELSPCAASSSVAERPRCAIVTAVAGQPRSGISGVTTVSEDPVSIASQFRSTCAEACAPAPSMRSMQVAAG